MASPEIMASLRAEGVQALPITVVNGRVISRGRYPTYQELIRAVAEPR